MRIPCSDIFTVPEGIVSGRIQSIEMPDIYCIDESGTAHFTVSRQLIEQYTPPPASGDIVTIHFTSTENKAVARSLAVLQRSKSDPQVDPGSLFFKLNRSGRRLLDLLRKKQRFMSSIRDFFIDAGFLEVHTPFLVPSPGVERFIEPFTTTYLDMSGKPKECYLPTSPEFALKGALSAGLERIFEIKKVFRNHGENSVLHRPEFFMLEWYRAYEGLECLVEDCRSLLEHCVREITGSTVFTRGGVTCDLSRIETVTVKECFERHDINLDLYDDAPEKFCTLVSRSLDIEPSGFTRDDLFFKFFLNRIEPRLGFECPVAVQGYPLAMSTLCEPDVSDSRYAQRFELFIHGIEIANAYGELRDPVEQRRRFESVVDERKGSGYSTLDVPAEFLGYLEAGIPPTAGIALGLDRLFMLLTGCENLSESELFPFLDYIG
jgi:lysyl-tRNA synthetase class 2